jgi:hypothetical protein
MSETTTQAPATTETKTDEKSSVVDAIFDIGTGWAALGLKAGKAALEQSAKTLETTARALDGFAKELEKK